MKAECYLEMRRVTGDDQCQSESSEQRLDISSETTMGFQRQNRIATFHVNANLKYVTESQKVNLMQAK